jgi:hypothetical protein
VRSSSLAKGFQIYYSMQSSPIQILFSLEFTARPRALEISNQHTHPILTPNLVDDRGKDSDDLVGSE